LESLLVTALPALLAFTVLEARSRWRINLSSVQMHRAALLGLMMLPTVSVLQVRACMPATHYAGTCDPVSCVQNALRD